MDDVEKVAVSADEERPALLLTVTTKDRVTVLRIPRPILASLQAQFNKVAHKIQRM